MADELRHKKTGINTIETTTDKIFKETHILKVSDDSLLETKYFGN